MLSSVPALKAHGPQTITSTAIPTGASLQNMAVHRRGIARERNQPLTPPCSWPPTTAQPSTVAGHPAADTTTTPLSKQKQSTLSKLKERTPPLRHTLHINRATPALRTEVAHINLVKALIVSFVVLRVELHLNIGFQHKVIYSAVRPLTGLTKLCGVKLQCFTVKHSLDIFMAIIRTG